MNTVQNNKTKEHHSAAKAAAARYRRRIERAEMADWKRATYTDPATGRAQTINIRHS